MSHNGKVSAKKLDGFLNKLSELVDALPSQETKSRLDRELAALITFLEGFRAKLKSLPTDGDVDGVTSTIETIKDFVRVAEADPVMSRVLGLSSVNGGLRKSPQRPLAGREREEAKIVAAELQTLSPGDVERKLADKQKYNVPILKQIGRELGLNLPSRATRLSIIEKITKKTANLRGYSYLRHGNDGSPLETDA